MAKIWQPGQKKETPEEKAIRIHLDKRPHHFDRLYETNPDEWRYWMYKVGWGEVLDYIGVGWRHDEDQITIDHILNGGEGCGHCGNAGDTAAGNAADRKDSAGREAV